MGFLKSLSRVADIILNPEEHRDIGSTGERFTYKEIKSVYRENQILRNVYLKKEDGEFTEIDLIFVGIRGVFVFESKNYSGWIFGDENQANWMQTLPNGFKTKFYNPIMQNNTHIKSLKLELPEYQDIRYFSIIVFSERCTLKEIKCEAQDTFILKRDGLRNLLMKIDKNEPTTIEEADKQAIIKKLYSCSRPTDDIKKQHIDELDKKLATCPFCKSELVERENKKNGNKFYGCPNFPKCRYTRDTE